MIDIHSVTLCYIIVANQVKVGIYGYGLQHDAPKQVKLPFATANKLHKVIREQFGTIVFCRRYLDRLGLDRYLAGVSTILAPQKQKVLTGMTS